MAALVRLLLVVFPLAAWYLYMRLHRWRFGKYKDFPQPPSSLLFGHLKLLGERMAIGDPKRHTDYVMRDISMELGNPPFYFLDLRPVLFPIVVINSHEHTEQISKPTSMFRYSVSKSPTLDEFLSVTGKWSILRQHDESWKNLRKRFNAGFAPQHLHTLLPKIVDKTRLLVERLSHFATNGEDFPLGDLCTAFTFDVIGAVTMDVDFRAQYPREQQNPMVQWYQELLGLYSNSVIPTSWFFTPRVAYRRQKLAKIVDEEIGKHVKAAFAQQRSKSNSEKQDSGRSVLSLSLKDVEVLTPLTIQQTVDQLKTFLFAGHDTTSTLLQWSFYELSRSPKVLDTLRRELDNVLGPDSDPKSIMKTLLERGDEVLSKLSYTSAIIKETLRLFPPAGSARMAPLGTGLMMKTEEGQEVCLDGMVLYNCHFTVHRDPKVYGDTAEDFRPDRWLGNVSLSADEYTTTNSEKGEKTAESIPASAWRPFERGPRNCIGQELANIEAKVVLACVARRFDFQKVGKGALKLVNGEYVVDGKGQYEAEEPLLNTRQITAKPLDNCMMKVKFH